jgi:hypothetical protein
VPQWRWNGRRCSSDARRWWIRNFAAIAGPVPPSLRRWRWWLFAVDQRSRAFRAGEDRLLLVAFVAATRNLSRGLSHGGSSHRLLTCTERQQTESPRVANQIFNCPGVTASLHRERSFRYIGERTGDTSAGSPMLGTERTDGIRDDRADDTVPRSRGCCQKRGCR